MRSFNWLLLLAAFVGTVYAANETIFTLRNAANTADVFKVDADWDAALLSILVMLTVDAAHLLGYTVGRFRRRPVHPPLPEDRPLSIAQITYTYQALIRR